MGSRLPKAIQSQWNYSATKRLWKMANRPTVNLFRISNGMVTDRRTIYAPSAANRPYATVSPILTSFAVLVLKTSIWGRIKASGFFRWLSSNGSRWLTLHPTATAVNSVDGSHRRRPAGFTARYWKKNSIRNQHHWLLLKSFRSVFQLLCSPLGIHSFFIFLSSVMIKLEWLAVP